MDRITGQSRSKTSPRFYACVAVLLATAGGMQVAAGVLEGYFRKLPLPLKKPLHLLDVNRLGPEYILYRMQPSPLSPEMIETLGTEEYLQWNLTDTQSDPGSPTSLARLFITYHTGGMTMVPHRPQECMSAAGMIFREGGIAQFTVPDASGQSWTIPVDVLEFEVPPRDLQIIPTGAGPGRMYVAYFFFTNGKYVTSRTEVRNAISTFKDKYAYYSKIEVSFSDEQMRSADRKQTEEATLRLLRKIMPILWADHYQDWEAIRNGAAPAGPTP